MTHIVNYNFSHNKNNIIKLKDIPNYDNINTNKNDEYIFQKISLNEFNKNY